MPDHRQHRLRNPVAWRERLARLRGSPVVFDLDRFDEPLDHIARIERDVASRCDRDLCDEVLHMRAAVSAGTSIADVRCRFFAVAREAALRALGPRPFDEQVLAALALGEGAIVEMQTGEGKTLAGAMAAALVALPGSGVHVLTFNDYLARRDANWMRPLYRALGLSVAFVEQGMAERERRSAYAADVTYVTAREAGFDRLRDLRAATTAAQVHRGFYAAVVDEADSLMIDEARVPLVLAGTERADASRAGPCADLVAGLTPGVHFDMDEYARDVELTDAGIDHLERVLGCGTLHDSENAALLSQVNCALHARALLHRDVDYLVRDGRIELVDEFTGRVVDDRRWPDGLHAALEAKEGLGAGAGGRILSSMTLQRFLRTYRRLAGMTGTARDAAEELHETYGTPTVIVPTHRPMIRVDRPDLIFRSRDAKEQAVLQAIVQAHRSGRPVLVGTRTIAESERLAALLKAAGLSCDVLNAQRDAEEAGIVARAGAIGAITIATNMAGRGTDIRLGGPGEHHRDEVVALGGLLVIGTNRHDSRRVDRQLRGRAGRQGDPGESRFYVSLEDDLLVRFGSGLLAIGWERRAGARREDRGAATRTPRQDRLASLDAPIDAPLAHREIAQVQRVIEGQDREIRRTLGEYAAVIDRQFDVVCARRLEVMQGTAVGIWRRAPGRREALVAAASPAAVDDAERLITLAHLDRLWGEHLAFCADLREGLHLVRLGGQDPLTRFTLDVVQAFAGFEAAVEAAVLASLDQVVVGGNTLDLSRTGLEVPAATWTYLVNDDPFRDQVALRLMGTGGATIAMYAAAVLGPLLLGWGIVNRLRRGRQARRAPPDR
jgi:preprotein translocase subunit SecA